MIEARTRDPEIAQAAAHIRNAAAAVERVQLVGKVGPAEDYLPPWER